MTLRNLTIVPMLAMALFAAGCGADCESLCEDQKDCKDSNIPAGTDCGDYCEAAEKVAKDADCEDEFDDLISCGGDQDDICKPDEDACDKESDAYGKCIVG